jgi:hypothetical protein
MSKRGNGYGSENRVNILKKLKVGKNWNLYPAVVEPNGKLRDKVRVRGKVELHPEGYYDIEWWQEKHGNKCAEGPFCSNFFLHKFRHTFATRNL